MDWDKMKIKIDVPIIFDDHFMMIKGNKKIIQHQLILKPIVKTGKNTVQIVTNYQKMFIERKGSVDFKTNTISFNESFSKGWYAFSNEMSIHFTSAEVARKYSIQVKAVAADAPNNDFSTPAYANSKFSLEGNPIVQILL